MPFVNSGNFDSLKRGNHDERGASMVEYALLVILIAIVAFVAVRVAGQNVSSAFSTVANGFVNPN
jgi:Flp pilus assembly pilin Flp